MDGLDILKKNWKKRTENLPRYTSEELMPMIYKKSSSNVKWIFIISVLEFAFWLVIDILVSSESYLEQIESEAFINFLKIVTVINYVVLFGFIFLFLKNYLRIRVCDSSKTLMRRIINTRASVKYYVWYNIGLFITIFIISGGRAVLTQTTFNTSEFWIVTAIMTFTLLLIVGLLILFYKVLYGFLTKRLMKNYEALTDMDD